MDLQHGEGKSKYLPCEWMSILALAIALLEVVLVADSS